MTGRRLTASEVRHLRELSDSGADDEALARAAGIATSQLRRLVHGAYLRGVAAVWDLPHAATNGDGDLVRTMLDAESLVIDQPVPLIVKHDYSWRYGTVTSWRTTTFGLQIEARIDRQHVNVVEQLLPTGLSVGVLTDSESDVWLDDGTPLRRNAALIEVSLTPSPGVKAATTDARLHDRREHDEWYDRVRFERMESRIDGRALDRRLAALGVRPA